MAPRTRKADEKADEKPADDVETRTDDTDPAPVGAVLGQVAYEAYSARQATGNGTPFGALPQDVAAGWVAAAEAVSAAIDSQEKD